MSGVAASRVSRLTKRSPNGVQCGPERSDESGQA